MARLSENGVGPVALKEGWTAGGENWVPQRLRDHAGDSVALTERSSPGARDLPAQSLGENAVVPVALKEQVTTGGGIWQLQESTNSSRVQGLPSGKISAGGLSIGHQVVSIEPHGRPVSLQTGAGMVGASEPGFRNQAPTFGTPLGIPIKMSAIPSNSVVPNDAVKATQGASNSKSAANLSSESKSKTIAKGRELNASSSIPAHGNAVLQPAAPTSVPGDLTHDKTSSSAIVEKAAPAMPQGTSSEIEIGSDVIHSRVGTWSAAAEALVPPATSGNSAVSQSVPSMEPPGATTGGSGRSGAGETFTALDAEGANRVTWVHAGAQQAEAGFEDPHLGWVSVRADVSGGAIHAALVPASTAAAQVMGGHLEGLNSYLSAHHSGVGTITLTAPSTRTNESAELGSSGQGMQEGSGRGASQESGQSGQDGQGASGSFAANRQSTAELDTGDASAGSMGTRDEERERATQPSATGGRISVMA